MWPVRFPMRFTNGICSDATLQIGWASILLGHCPQRDFLEPLCEMMLLTHPIISKFVIVRIASKNEEYELVIE